MKIGTLNGRAVLIAGDRALDIANASGGQYGPDVQTAYADWPAFSTWAATVDATAGDTFAETALGNPTNPRQVFAIGLNYRAHAEETGSPIPTMPVTFTKFPSSLAGPFDNIVLHGPTTDWEVELVVVLGIDAYRVSEADAWDHVAGLTVGQDISERTIQRAAGAQFSLGKSFHGYGPLGPWVVSTDEFANPNDLALSTRIDGQVVQDSRTSDLIFSVPSLIAQLSAILPLWAGDIIFTGTPSGVGVARSPQRFLQPGEILETTIEGIGSLRNRIVAEG